MRTVPRSGSRRRKERAARLTDVTRPSKWRLAAACVVEEVGAAVAGMATRAAATRAAPTLGMILEIRMATVWGPPAQGRCSGASGLRQESVRRPELRPRERAPVGVV